MLQLPREDIILALNNASDGLESYQWIQSRVRHCNVSRDTDFQRRFNGFYRVRRNAKWRQSFYALMEAKKEAGIDFPEILRSLRKSTGQLEASFSSKLAATLDPGLPVIDRFVLGNFGLKLPYWQSTDRESRVIKVCEDLRVAYDRLMMTEIGKMVEELFDRRYPEAASIPTIKKLDLVLWQSRPS